MVKEKTQPRLKEMTFCVVAPCDTIRPLLLVWRAAVNAPHDRVSVSDTYHLSARRGELPMGRTWKAGGERTPFIQRMTREWKFDFGRVIDCDAQTLLLS